MRQLAGKALWAGLASGATVAGAAYCEVDKYFDPEALERGAKALREINTSPHAKRVSCSSRWRPRVAAPPPPPLHRDSTCPCMPKVMRASNRTSARLAPWSPQVFEQIKAQEATKQAELKVKEAEFKVAAEKAAIVSGGGGGLEEWCWRRGGGAAGGGGEMSSPLVAGSAATGP